MNPTLLLTLGFLLALVVIGFLCTRFLRPFHRRAIVCLTAVLLSALVVSRSGYQYANGEGGFRLGVDLVGGTILVYEVDTERLAEQKQDNPNSKDFDPGFRGGYVRKKDAAEVLARGVAQMAEYQDRLAAQDTYAVLVVLQALDAAGKDGTIKHVMSGVNPQGVSVHGFKVPSAQELDHDYLWRYARNLPSRGRIGIFNRSYYEEVLVVRVHPENLTRQHLPPSTRKGDIWDRRFREIYGEDAEDVEVR